MAMKELTIEEKAKRFDEVLGKAKRYYNEYKTRDNILYVEDMEDVFPELKENEDEKIRKEIKQHFLHLDDSFPDKAKWLTWLKNHSDKPQGKSALEEIKEEKVDNANKVIGEPKFKIGDWVVSPNGVYWHIDAIQDGHYQVSSNSGQSANWLLDTNIYHRFTIQDAKDCDVLADSFGIILFRKIGNTEYKDVIDYYCYTNGRRFKKQKDFEYWGDVIACALHPATKEQRDALMKAMTDAGYIFDFEKKELKKIEQKDAWSEDVEAAITLLKNIAEEQDDDYCPHNANHLLKAAQYLEICRPQTIWKPSDKQMNGIECAIKTLRHQLNVEDKRLDSLYEDLKKLKE